MTPLARALPYSLLGTLNKLEFQSSLASMIGAGKQNTEVLNRLVMIFLFALVGFVLGSCGQYGKDDAPENNEGDLGVRSQYLDSLEDNGVAKVGETTFRERKYSNFIFNGCQLKSEKVRHKIDKFDESEYRISVKHLSPSFEAALNPDGQSCAGLYRRYERDYFEEKNTQEETSFRREFVSDGCSWVKKEIGRSIPDLELKECKITFEREEDLSGQEVGSMRLQALFNDGTQDHPINEKFYFFLKNFLWVDQFEASGTGYVTDSDGTQRQFNYNEDLKEVTSNDTSNNDLNSNRSREVSSKEKMVLFLLQRL